MKKLILLIGLNCLWLGCATHSAYETGEFRNRDYQSTLITLTDGGLSSRQIETISATKPPGDFPVDLSIILVKDRYLNNELEQLFISQVIENLTTSQNIDRIVPVPKYLLPDRLTFPVIQELGIRTLTEYVLVFIVDSESFFRNTKILETQFEITSAAEFIIVDSRTTAILASDLVFSQKTYQQNVFKTGEKQAAQVEIFAEQGKLVGEKLAALFSPRKDH